MQTSMPGPGLEPPRGPRAVLELQPQRLSDVHRYLDQIARQCDDALTRLQAYIEDPSDGDQDDAPPAGTQ